MAGHTEVASEAKDEARNYSVVLQPQHGDLPSIGVFQPYGLLENMPESDVFQNAKLLRDFPEIFGDFLAGGKER